MTWKRGLAVEESNGGGWWLVKTMVYVRGSGVRLHLKRPRSSLFINLTDAARRFTPRRLLEVT